MRIVRPIIGLLIAGLCYPTLGLAQLTRLDTTQTAPLLTIYPNAITTTDATTSTTVTPTDPAIDPATDPATDTTTSTTTVTPTDSTNDPAIDPATDTTVQPTYTRPPLDTPPPPETPSTPLPGTGTFVPPPLRPPLTPADTPPECPEIEPTPQNPQPICPPATEIPVIPQLPIALMLTPFLAVVLLWAVLAYMGGRQRAVESRFMERHLRTQHAQTVNLAKQKIYREFVDFLSSSNSSDRPLNNPALEQYISKLSLLGSPKINELGQKVQTAFLNNDRATLKPLLKDLAAQIKLEL